MMLHVVVFMVSPANWCPSGASEGDLIGKLAFCRCNQLRSSWFKVNPDFSGRCLHKREEREIPVEKQGITQARTGGEAEVTQLQARKHRGQPRSWEWRKRASPASSARAWPCCSPDSGLPAYRVRRGSIFVVLSNLTTCYHSPRNLEQCVLGWSRRNHWFHRLPWPTPTWRLHVVLPGVPWACEGKILVTRESFLGNCWWSWN